MVRFLVRLRKQRNARKKREQGGYGSTATTVEGGDVERCRRDGMVAGAMGIEVQNSS